MDRNAINICGQSPVPVDYSLSLHVVRVRPWHPEKELPYVAAPAQPQQLFLGEGAFVNSPRKPAGGSVREVIGEISSATMCDSELMPRTDGSPTA